MKLKPVTNGDGTPYGYRFECPGCGDPHVIPTTGPHAWGFNGDVDRPTFTPSIVVQPAERWGDGTPNTTTPRCHSFVRDGRIEFLSDCGHTLAGQTVELPEITP